ncbi:MAG: 4Fe-4S dicluster domain-containing protein [Bacteroidota bacterium]
MSNDQEKKVVIDREQFPALFEALKREGYRIIGPTVRDEVIIYDEINGVEDLPIGRTDEQAPGSYSLKNGRPDALFGFTVGPQSPKKFLFPMRLKLFEAQKEGRGFNVSSNLNSISDGIPRLAFLGIKSCELSAIEIQDKILFEGIYADPYYRTLRERSLIIAVNCTTTGNQCFCDSMKTGPKAIRGYDIALTEIISGYGHYFVADMGSDKGSALIQSVPHHPAESSQLKIEERAIEEAVDTMGRKLDTRDIENLLFTNLEHPEWDNVALRCLTCANCTLVCPTCFCMTVEDTTDITGEHTERWRRLNSCFTLDFAKVAGGNFRASAKSRYRQWLTHKLAGWYQQFGTSGCVGCGRCITWCPVGIDIIAEVETIRGDRTSRNE